MGERMRRLASSFSPPWVSESEALPDEQVLGRFTGLWTIVYVTANWVGQGHRQIESRRRVPSRPRLSPAAPEP